MIMFASSICTQIRIYVRGCTSTKTYSALRWNAVDWPMLHKFRCLKNDNIRTLFPANQGNRKPYCHEMCWCLDKYACAYINYNIYIFIIDTWTCMYSVCNSSIAWLSTCFIQKCWAYHPVKSNIALENSIYNTSIGDVRFAALD